MFLLRLIENFLLFHLTTNIMPFIFNDVLSVSETDGAKIQQFPELLRIAGLI